MGPDLDQDLVAQAQAGNESAFVELVRRHTSAVYRLSLRMTANPSDAEEVLQEVFLRLHRKLDSFRGEARFSTWLHRLTVNAALMFLRKTRNARLEQELDESLPAFDGSGTLARLDVDYSTPARVEELLEQRELLASVLSALDALPEQYRVPFVLRDLEELETAEVAELLGIEQDLVRQRVHRARLAIRKQLCLLAEGAP